MKVLLRDEKGFYYKCEEEWTACADSAVDFKRTFAAIEFARDKGLDSTEVVLWFDNPEYDISLPVRGVQGNGKR